MAFFAPGGTPGFNQALLKGGGLCPFPPFRVRWHGKTDMSHRHDYTLANNTLVYYLYVFDISLLYFWMVFVH